MAKSTDVTDDVAVGFGVVVCSVLVQVRLGFGIVSWIDSEK